MTVVELMEELASLADEETATLAAAGGLERLGPIAAAKQRQLEALEVRLAEKQRAHPGWAAELDSEAFQRLQQASAVLQEASERNRAALSRQLQLTDDLVGAVARELQRRTGGRNRTYAEAGRLREQTQPAPVSINTNL